MNDDVRYLGHHGGQGDGLLDIYNAFLLLHR